jgi:hypothetical protein
VDHFPVLRELLKEIGFLFDSDPVVCFVVVVVFWCVIVGSIRGLFVKAGK